MWGTRGAVFMFRLCECGCVLTHTAWKWSFPNMATICFLVGIKLSKICDWVNIVWVRQSWQLCNIQTMEGYGCCLIQYWILHWSFGWRYYEVSCTHPSVFTNFQQVESSKSEMLWFLLALWLVCPGGPGHQLGRISSKAFPVKDITSLCTLSECPGSWPGILVPLNHTSVNMAKNINSQLGRSGISKTDLIKTYLVIFW